MNTNVFAPAALAPFAPPASAFAPMTDAWRAAHADRHVSPGMPSTLPLNSIVSTTGVVRGASAQLVSTAGRLAYGAAKQAAPPRGRLR